MIDRKKQIFTVIGMFTLILMLITVTYAFFNYTRTGTINNLGTGRISFNSEQNGSLNMTNIFPMTSTEAGISQLDTVTVGIQGDTTYANGEEFEITLVDVTNTINDKKIPINYIATYESTEGNSIGEESDTYWESRNSKNADIYTLTETGSVEEGKQVLVGYIKNSVTGINGILTIKVYVDADRIAITDTPDENSEWQRGRTVFTTSEWNSFQTSGTPISFKIKAESNEGIWVYSADRSSLYNIISSQNHPLDNENSTYVQNVSNQSLDTRMVFLNNAENQGKVIKLSAGIDFSKSSGIENGFGIYTRAGTENMQYPIYYYRGAVDNNNVLFAGFCWLIVRTTDTGGIKLVYNGIRNGTTCLSKSSESSNSEPDSKRKELETAIYEDNFYYSGYNLNDSPAYVGYMYGTPYQYNPYGNPNSFVNNARFGSGFSWNGSYYTLIDDTLTSPDSSHHYSCNLSTENGTCSEIRFVFDSDNDYIVLTDGDGIEQAIAKMLTNTTDSYAKTKIDSWYQSNMTHYTDQLEDTIWCNDRSIGEYNGWSDTGSIDNNNYNNYMDQELIFNGFERCGASNDNPVKNKPSLSCPNLNDRFTVSEINGNGKLSYPVGLLTADEYVLAGGSMYSINTEFYLYNGIATCTMTPGHGISIFAYDYLDVLTHDYWASGQFALRPAISLKHDTQLVDNGADGTAEHPYVVLDGSEVSNEVSNEVSGE